MRAGIPETERLRLGPAQHKRRDRVSIKRSLACPYIQGVCSVVTVMYRCLSLPPL